MVDPQTERTARAICRVEAERYANRLEQEPWIDLNWPQFVPQARAAMEAQTGTGRQPMTLAHRAAVEVMAEAMNNLLVPGEHTMRQFATAALRALIEAGWWVVRWQPIETAPEDGTQFLAFDAFGEFQIVRMDEGLFRSYETGKHAIIDKWTPLPPSPPEADNAE